MSAPGPPDWPLDRLGRRLCRALLLLGPPSFRRRFGPALLEAISVRVDDLRRTGGTSAALRYWIHSVVDLGRSLAGEWIDTLRPARRDRPLASSSSPESLFMDNLLMDLRFALRTLARRPGLTAIILLTLALAIGANTAIFSILDAVVLRPLPFEEPDELVVLIDDLRGYDMPAAPLAEYEYRVLRDSSRTFEELEATTMAFQAPLNDDEGRPEQVSLASYTPGFLEMLGVAPMIGRSFAEEDGRPMAQDVLTDPNAVVPRGVAILGHDFWQRRFGGDTAVLGRTIEVGSREHEVVGVMGPDFRLFWPAYQAGQPTAGPVDVHVPLQADIDNAVTGAGYLQVVGRMAEGVTFEQAAAEVEAITARQRQEHERSGRADIHTYARRWSSEVSSPFRPALVALLGAVGFVLLVACANIANLLLARAVDRRQEIAIRAALGAGRARIARQSLTESLLLAVVGAGLGLLLASWGVRALLALVPADLPRVDLVGVNPTVALFTLGATVLAVLLFGSVPALMLASTRGSGTLNDRGTGGGSLGRSRLRSGLVVLEVALSLVLLVGAGLMLRSFSALQEVELGFQPASVTTFQVSPPVFAYQGPEAQGAFLQNALTRIEGLPGVEAAGAVGTLPLSGGMFSGTFRTADMAEDQPRVEGNFRGASYGYFAATGIPVLSGRPFELSEPDVAVAVVDQRFDESVFPDRSAVGETIEVMLPDFTGQGGQLRPIRIVGVVGNIQDQGIVGETRRTLYFPHELLGFTQYSFAVRSPVPLPDLMPLVREQIAAVDPELPIYDVRPMQGYVDEALAPTRFTLVLILLFGGFAVLLAAVGLYGVLSQTVREQTRDIGVRMAFGATAAEVLRGVVGRGTLLAGVGAALGLAVAIPLTRAMRSLFVGIEPTDPLTLAATTLMLLGIGVVACFVPARRAARMDPASSLRAE